MKANEAPEKFYLLPNGFISYFRNTDEDIEYTRTNAVIEKACEFIRKGGNRGDAYIVTELGEEVKSKMQEGLAKIQPKVVEMTNIIMDAYQEGFNTCFELLTGQKFK